MHSTDDLVALARRQHAVFSGAQATNEGVSRKVLRQRVASGWLTTLGHDVFHVAGTPVTWEAMVMAATLAGGPGTVASHRTAAALWGLDGYARAAVEVTVPRGVRLRRAGTIVHTSTDLDRCASRSRSGIDVTDPARTLLDLARSPGAGAPPPAPVG